MRGASLPLLEKGQVWLVGAGPGDPGLLTLQALSAIEQADVILYDSLLDARILALVPAETRCENVGKRRGRPSPEQGEISRRLVELARQGLRVVRLKGGDPLVFGRGAEEALALAREGVPFRIVPGITSGLAALASAGIPATLRGLNQGIVLATGHGAHGPPELDWEGIARSGLPVVLYMALYRLGELTERLAAAGVAADTPAALIASATRESERVLVSTLGRVAEDARAQGVSPPAILVLGEIVRVREALRELAPFAAERTA